MPTLISAIVKDFKLSKTDLEFVRDRFNNKNSDGLEKISKRLKIISDALIDSVGDAKINLKKLKKLNLQKKLNLKFKVLLKLLVE